MVDVAQSGNPVVREMLSRHPKVSTVSQGALLGVSFSQGPWQREVLIGQATNPLYGLVELMDNNPVVCADRMSVPSPATTLALIALGPLADAGLIEDSPTVIVNIEGDEEEISSALAAMGWAGGAFLHSEPMDLEGVAAATVMVAIRTPDDLDEIDDLFEERFGRSFFVRRDEDSEWDASLVRGKPLALYRLRISPDQPNSLLTVRVLADLQGKLGAAQVVHAMNVMCGFEESLGISQ